ncbi:protein PERCC1-like [Diadema antillarum]|uniref:protein PERCC1-like n=1 Tax=Diadema antillarum TaxID=105358 RepID=UPI003A8993B3
MAMPMMNYPMHHHNPYPQPIHNYVEYTPHNTHIQQPESHHNYVLSTPHVQYVHDNYYPDESDDESNLTSEDYEDDRMSDDFAEVEPSAVDQLLQFAEMVNQDIQKYFGRKRVLDEPELIADCNKKVRLSGRELYYADLLRVAQQGDSADPCQETPKPSRIIRYGGDEIGDHSPHLSPKENDGNGLGPLEELFEYAEWASSYNNHVNQVEGYPLINCARSSWTSSAKNFDALKCGGKFSSLPWRKRALPKSFFSEPCPEVVHTNTDRRFNGLLSIAVSTHCSASISSSNHHETPDFSDLMATMEADDDHGLPRVTPVHG